MFRMAVKGVPGAGRLQMAEQGAWHLNAGFCRSGEEVGFTGVVGGGDALFGAIERE